MKVSIIGGGGLVGSSAGFALQAGGIVREIALVDVNQDLAEGQALDIMHGSSLTCDQKITFGGTEHVTDSDMVVITAGLRRKPDESRLDLINRNVDLFRIILADVNQHGLKPDAMVFDMWFASGRFTPDWALSRLEEYLEVAPSPEPDHLVLKELSRLAPTHVNRVLRTLDRIVRADREGWRVQMWMDSARTILEVAMRAGGDTRESAERLIDHLGRRGFSDLAALLKIQQGT